MYQFYFYVPEDHLEQVKQAVFAAGAGDIGHYEHCCWQTQGRGQFRPMAGSDAFVGQVGELAEIPEVKVEMVCPKEQKHNVVAALKESHPYEEIAFGFIHITK